MRVSGFVRRVAGMIHRMGRYVSWRGSIKGINGPWLGRGSWKMIIDEIRSSFSRREAEKWRGFGFYPEVWFSSSDMFDINSRRGLCRFVCNVGKRHTQCV